MNRRELLQRVAVLMGGAVSAPAIVGVLSGCSAKNAPGWKPQFLNEAQAGLVAEIADIVIPRTDTPGAKDVGVVAFIDTMLKDVYAPEDRERFLRGLADFEKLAQRDQGGSFLQLERGLRVTHVRKVHDAAVVAERAKPQVMAALHRPFILMMKELTLLGFLTSEVGATQVLQYVAVPGEYRACVPVAQAGNGKAWAE